MQPAHEGGEETLVSAILSHYSTRNTLIWQFVATFVAVETAILAASYTFYAGAREAEPLGAFAAVVVLILGTAMVLPIGIMVQQARNDRNVNLHVLGDIAIGREIYAWDAQALWWVREARRLLFGAMVFAGLINFLFAFVIAVFRSDLVGSALCGMFAS